MTASTPRTTRRAQQARTGSASPAARGRSPASSKPTPSRSRSQPSKSTSSKTTKKLQYADGKPKPKFRGYLHGLGSVIFGGAALYLTLQTGRDSALGSQHAQNWWGLVALCFGKFMNYFSSAVLHLYPFKDTFWVTEALKADLVCITLSVGFSAMAFEPVWSPESLSVFWWTIFFMLANLACVYWTFAGHIGLRTPQGRSEVPRNICLVIQFLYVATKIGKSQDYSFLWMSAILFYVFAFAFAGPVTAAHDKEPVYFFWHKIQRNGLHEDFHNVLAIADALMVVMAYQHIKSME
ncbi:hypothetical protein TeGR_g13092 [Tetraparma gracilis]|uniref:Uncharacterized protein n=1 Tax=Tetraparma gracilis TaxID=2962635 RepID=A0ABQ6N1B0_9STRA|nr:hypothetical protein TeGR_g13092 [Tetraparma gracilis]